MPDAGELAAGRRLTWLALSLAVLVVALFGRAVTFDFVALDDRVFLLENRHVRDGVTLRGLAWSLGPDSIQFHPLTWLSHMVDFELFGTRPAARHAQNVLLHAGSAALLFLFLARATGRTWAAYASTLLFAIHPLRVESVAWIFERKDVLSVFFAMATLVVWERYGRTGRRRDYLGAMGLAALALLAKPMMVTLPVLLLLVDVWPLGRFSPDAPDRARNAWRLVREKLLVLPLALVSGIVTILANVAHGGLWSMSGLTVSRRLSLAVEGMVWYLQKSLWPADLACMYLIEPQAPTIVLTGMAALLAAITAAAVHLRRRCPAVLFGWLWYLVSIAPVSGLLQAGPQATADRYSYFPSVGLVIAAVFGAWTALEHLSPRRARAWARLAVGVPALLFGTLTWLQLPVWRDSVSLYLNAVSVSPRNWMARYNLATVMAASGALEPAAEQLRIVLALRPGWPPPVGTLVTVLEMLGRHQEIPPVLEEALRVAPGSALLRSIAIEAYGKLGDETAAARLRGPEAPPAQQPRPDGAGPASP